MNPELRAIGVEFEAALLNGIRTGADEVALTKIRDQAFGRLRDIKETLRKDGQLEAFFAVAAEITTNTDMALETIRQVDAVRLPNRPCR